MSKVILAAALVVALSGCTTNYPGSKQEMAGVRYGKISYNAKTGDLNADIGSGMESDTTELSGETTAEGLKFSYRASGSKAFVGQMTQAELSGLVSGEISKSLAPVMDAVRLLTPGIAR